MEPLALRALSPRSCSLGVRAQPGARQPGLVGLWNGRLKIAVRSPAQDGRANEELIEALADALGLPRKSLSLVSGAKNRLKEIALPLPIEVARRLIDDQLRSE